MDFNKISYEIKKWLSSSNIFRDINIILKEEINFDNIQTLTIDLEDDNNLGIIIIYEDYYLFFDFISKNDEQMKSYNRSDNFLDFENLKLKIEKYFEKYWK